MTPELDEALTLAAAAGVARRHGATEEQARKIAEHHVRELDELERELDAKLPCTLIEMHYSTGATQNVTGLRWAGTPKLPLLEVSLSMAGLYAIALTTGKLAGPRGRPLPVTAVRAQLELDEQLREAILRAWWRWHRRTTKPNVRNLPAADSISKEPKP